jgi:Recombinase zinc beta ribbon domain
LNTRPGGPILMATRRSHHAGRRHGGTYFYFMCRGRQQHQCDHPYVPVDVMEEAVEQHYTHTVILPADFRATVRAGVAAAVSDHYELSDDLRAQFTQRLEKLDNKESYFLDLAAEEGWPKTKLREKIDSIRGERQKITRQLDQTTSQLDTGRQVFTTALDLLDDPSALYRKGHEQVKSILNKAFFTRLYIDGRKVSDHQLTEPFDMLHEAYTIYRQHQTERQAEEDTRHGGQQAQGRTYYRSSDSVALTSELGAATRLPEPMSGTLDDWSQTAGSADLLAETGAAERQTMIHSLALALAGHGFK